MIDRDKRWLAFYLLFVLAIAMWNFSTFDLGTDYRHFALARALQGLGIAPLFVPVSQLAYSYLPKNKNNKASSLTNLPNYHIYLKLMIDGVVSKSFSARLTSASALI